VVEIDAELEDMAAVLAAADAACYEAKHAGRNVVRLWRRVSDFTPFA
jgi:PleD family two-component response regulator